MLPSPPICNSVINNVTNVTLDVITISILTRKLKSMSVLFLLYMWSTWIVRTCSAQVSFELQICFNEWWITTKGGGSSGKCTIYVGFSAFHSSREIIGGQVPENMLNMCRKPTSMLQHKINFFFAINLIVNIIHFFQSYRWKRKLFYSILLTTAKKNIYSIFLVWENTYLIKYLC